MIYAHVSRKDNEVGIYAKYVILLYKVIIIIIIVFIR